MKHLRWVIPSLLISVIAVVVWRDYTSNDPEVEALDSLIAQKNACVAQAQTAYKMDWCNAQLTEAIAARVNTRAKVGQ